MKPSIHFLIAAVLCLAISHGALANSLDSDPEDDPINRKSLGGSVMFFSKLLQRTLGHQEEGVISGSCDLKGYYSPNDVSSFYLVLPRGISQAMIVNVRRDPAARGGGHVVNGGYLTIGNGNVRVTETMSGALGTALLMRWLAERILDHPLYMDTSYEAALQRAPAQDCPMGDAFYRWNDRIQGFGPAESPK